jgi:deferrochelatase/peroxidase EfeB
VHALLTIHGRSRPALVKECDIRLDAAKRGFEPTYIRDGAKLQDGSIHFGYRDGISQPNIEGLPDRNSQDAQPMVPTGAFVLGYESQFEGHFYDFEFKDFPAALGRNGTFAAFRIMKQDVKGFEEFLKKKAKADGSNPELVAAQLCGRWRDGTPLVISPNQPKNDQTNNFDYSGPNAAACPFTATSGVPIRVMTRLQATPAENTGSSGPRCPTEIPGDRGSMMTLIGGWSDCSSAPTWRISSSSS